MLVNALICSLQFCPLHENEARFGACMAPSPVALQNKCSMNLNKIDRPANFVSPGGFLLS